MDAARDTIKQSRPLKLSEVKFIEEFMMSDLNVFDRYIAGCILFAIYSRSRWSDLAFLSDLCLDTAETELGLVGFVEGSTKFQKTGSTALKRAMQMPLVAPIRGVTDKSWAVEWFNILKTSAVLIHQQNLWGRFADPPQMGHWAPGISLQRRLEIFSTICWVYMVRTS